MKTTLEILPHLYTKVACFCFQGMQEIHGRVVPIWNVLFCQVDYEIPYIFHKVLNENNFRNTPTFVYKSSLLLLSRYARNSRTSSANLERTFLPGRL